MRKWLVLIIIGVGILTMGGCLATQYNKEQDKRIDFEVEYRSRTAEYSKVTKILAGKGIVAKANDTAFQNVVRAFMENRKDGEAVGMKWITEAYPNVDAGKIQEMYMDLSRAIEAQREAFFQTERKLSDIKGQHDRILRRFPGNIFFSIMGTKPIDYKIIADTRTNRAVETGVDDNVDPFAK
jgi:hypothetical protein